MKPADLATATGMLFTDQYQLTMAQLYFRMGMHEKWAQFDHFFRHYPDYGDHQAGYCINAGLEWLLDWMKSVHFREEDLKYLRGQRNSNNEQLFADDFLDWLCDHGSFHSLTIYAIPEGRVVHPNVPLTVVEGPLVMAQILETALLNKLNYQILIATKAARVRQAARGRGLLEFGLRRAQGDGAIAGARAALIGGAGFTSNVGISHVLGYPPKGTHAHSMVQAFMALGHTELDAFRAYADVYPDDCLLLVDTINTLESGVPNAIKVFEELKAKGHTPQGVRLDSGDLAYLSIQVAKMLNDAGFEDVSIVLSNQIDERVAWQIMTQIEEEAPRYGIEADHVIKRLVFGVGTRLITSEGEAALGGVYKLVAMKENGGWQPAIKLSETPEKIPNPGHKRAWRLYDQRGSAVADLLGLHDENPADQDEITLHHPTRHGISRTFQNGDIAEIEPLHVKVMQGGDICYDLPTIDAMRQVRDADLERLDPGIKRIIHPHIYHVSLTPKLWDLKQNLIQSTRE